MAVPTVRRRRLGAELRAIREARGLSLEQVQDGLGYDMTRLSKLENARIAVKVPEVEKILDFYEYQNGNRDDLLLLARDGGKRGWWLSLSGLTPFFADLLPLEAEASRIKTYSPNLMPGLLQTPEYARAIITATRLMEVGRSVEDQVELRMARQGVLRKPDAPHVWFVMHEAALVARIAGDDGSIMREQLQRLVSLAKLPNVELQVVPNTATLHAGLAGGGFTIIGFPESSDLDVVHTDRMGGAAYIEDKEEVALYSAAFQKVTAEALSPDASLRRITQLKDEIK